MSEVMNTIQDNNQVCHESIYTFESVIPVMSYSWFYVRDMEGIVHPKIKLSSLLFQTSSIIVVFHNVL